MSLREFPAVTNKQLLERIEALESVLKPQSVAMAYRKAAQTLTNVGFQKINIDTVIQDPGNNLKIAESAYIVPAEGFYAVLGEVAITVPGTSNFIAIISKNAGTVLEGTRAVQATESVAQTAVAGIVFAKKGDKIELWAFYDGASKGELAIVNEVTNFLAIMRVGEGPQGRTGAQGERGLEGKEGVKGEKGTQGEKGGVLSVKEIEEFIFGSLHAKKILPEANATGEIGEETKKWNNIWGEFIHAGELITTKIKGLTTLLVEGISTFFSIVREKEIIEPAEEISNINKCFINLKAGAAATSIKKITFLGGNKGGLELVIYNEGANVQTLVHEGGLVGYGGFHFSTGANIELKEGELIHLFLVASRWRNSAH